MTAKRALCVGINKFKHIPQSNWLYGCVNDANDMSALLTSKYGFAAGDVTVLTDAKATKKAVMSKLEAMVKGAEHGTVKHIVFTYSSHGTQVPDTSGDELDLVDEALVAYDLAQAGDQWDLNTVLVDDELGALFARVPAGVLVEVYLDTCHSGTGLKAMDLLPGRMPRFLPPPTPIGLDQILDRSVGLETRTVIQRKQQSRFFRRKRSAGATGAAKAAGSTPVLFAACQANQTSSDASFKGRSNGAFTYYLLQTLKKTPAASRADLVKAIRAGLKSDRFDQVPQLEAAASAKKVKVGA